MIVYGMNMDTVLLTLGNYSKTPWDTINLAKKIQCTSK